MNTRFARNCCLTALMYLATFGVGYAQEEADDGIGAQPLSAALQEFADRSGLQVVYLTELASGVRTNGAAAGLSTEQTLDQLLENTGLEFEFVNNRTVAITEKGANESGSGNFQPAPQRTLIAQAQTPAPQQTEARPSAAATNQAEKPEKSLFAMEEVVVTGTSSPGRTKFDSTVAISTFDEDAIQRKAPMSTADMLTEVPSFWVEPTSGTTHGNVFARGLSADGGYRYVSLQEDGLPLYPVNELSFYNPDDFVRVDAFVERVEALRGGTAGIFSSGAAGGIINMITRRAGLEPEAFVKFTGTDYSLFRGDFYASTPFGDGWGVAVGGYLRSSDGIRDPGYTADEGGQIHFKINRDFRNGEIELFGKYLEDQSLFVVPIPLTGSGPNDPRELPGQDGGEFSIHSRDIADAGLPASADNTGVRGQDLEDGINPEVFTIGARVTWDFTDAITVNNVFRYTDADMTFDGIFPTSIPETGSSFAAARGVAPNFTVLSTGEPFDPNQLVRNDGHWAVAKDFEAIQNDFRVNFNLFDSPLGDHQLAVGFYYTHYEMEDRWSLGNLLLTDLSDRPQRLLLATDPATGVTVTSPEGFTLGSFFNLRTDDEADLWAIYLADEWQVFEKLRVDVGLRYDNLDMDLTINDANSTVDIDGDPLTTFDVSQQLLGPPNRVFKNLDFDEIQYTAGLNFDIADGQALFARYTNVDKLPHFDDVRGGTLTGGAGDVPENIEHIEVGYKVLVDYIGGAVTVFQTEGDSAFRDFVAGGVQLDLTARTRVQGIEIEGAMQPLGILNYLDFFNFANPQMLDLEYSITLQEPVYTNFTSENISRSGNRIRRIPETMIRIKPILYFDNLPFGDSLQIYGTYSRIGSRFADFDESVKLGSYFKIDLGAIYDFNEHLTFQITADNVTDELGLTEGNPRTDLTIGAPVGGVFSARPIFGTSVQGSVSYRF